MNNKEFYKILKDKTAFLVNFLAVISIVVSGSIYLYSKVFNTDELTVTYNVLFVPQKDYNELLYNYELNKDSVHLENCFTLTQIGLFNNGKRTIKNIKISLNNYFSDQSGIPKGFYIKSDDTLKYFEGKSEIKISKIKPKEYNQINIYSENSGIYQDDIIVSDEGFSKARELKSISVENDFDNWITSSVVENKVIQVLVFIFTLIGIYYLFKRIIPNTIKLLPTKNIGHLADSTKNEDDSNK